MKRIVVEAERCKGCGLCVNACPKGLLVKSSELNLVGYHPAMVVSSNECTGCLNCAIICPDVAIEVYSDDRKR